MTANQVLKVYLVWIRGHSPVQSRYLLCIAHIRLATNLCNYRACVVLQWNTVRLAPVFLWLTSLHSMWSRWRWPAGRGRSRTSRASSSRPPPAAAAPAALALSVLDEIRTAASKRSRAETVLRIGIRISLFELFLLYVGITQNVEPKMHFVFKTPRFTTYKNSIALKYSKKQEWFARQFKK